MSTHADTSSEDLGGRRDDLADRRDDLADRRDDRRDDRADDRRDGQDGHLDATRDVRTGGADGHTDARRDDDGPGRYTRQHGDHAGQHDHDAQDDQGVSVLDPTASERLRNRWQEVQAGFVDEPRQSVTEADQLVGEVLDEVSRVFRDQRSELEAEWSGNAEPGTEELRQALRRYREFFDRLLSL